MPSILAGVGRHCQVSSVTCSNNSHWASWRSALTDKAKWPLLHQAGAESRVWIPPDLFVMQSFQNPRRPSWPSFHQPWINVHHTHTAVKPRIDKPLALAEVNARIGGGINLHAALFSVPGNVAVVREEEEQVAKSVVLEVVSDQLPFSRQIRPKRDKIKSTTTTEQKNNKQTNEE